MVVVVHFGAEVGIFLNSLDGKENHGVLVDSGATKSLFRSKDRFLEIFFTQVVSLTGLGGKCGTASAWLGRLKPNRFDVDIAVYFPKLPAGFEGIMAVEDLQTKGWMTIFPGRSSNDTPPDAGFSINVRSGKVENFKKHGKLSFVDWDRELEAESFIAVGEEQFEGGEDTDNSLFLLEEGVVVEEDIFLSRGEDKRTPLEKHKASGHILRPPGFEIMSCSDCAASLGNRGSFRKARPNEHCTQIPLKGLSGDFWGPWPKPSIRKCKIILVVLCDACRFVWVVALVSKAQVVAELRRIIAFIRRRYGTSTADKVSYWVRFDNEPVLTSGKLEEACSDLRLDLVHSVPYTPQHNGAAERMMREVGKYTSIVMRGVDIRLICYGTEFVGDCLNNLPRKRYPRLGGTKYNNKTPAEVLQMYFPAAYHQKRPIRVMKRFGCLVFFLILGGKVEKGTPKWRRGVFLGYNGSGYKVGSWVTDARKVRFEEKGPSFSEKTTIQVRFFENILVADLDWLKPEQKGVFLRFDKLDALLESDKSTVQTITSGDEPAETGRRTKYRLGPGLTRRPMVEPNRRSAETEDSELTDSAQEETPEEHSRTGTGAVAQKQKKRRIRPGRERH